MAEAAGASRKERLGVWLKERLRYEWLLRRPAPAQLAIANRNERLEAAPDGEGQACLWRFTSRLHAPRLQPELGRRLLERCLAAAPVRRRSAPPWDEGPPELSVLIGHRGSERLPLLLATLESLAAQEDVRLECLVIEQDSEPRIADRLPPWVRHVHGPCPTPPPPTTAPTPSTSAPARPAPRCCSCTTTTCSCRPATPAACWSGSPVATRW